LLESANRWHDISWYGLLIAGTLTALAASATVSFVFVQFWSSSVRERNSGWRTNQLELQTEQARAEFAQASADISHANKKIAEAQRDAAQARFAQEQLKEKLAWRRMTRQQHDDLVAALRANPITIPIYVETVNTDPEAVQYWEDVLQTLKDAGMNVVGQEGGHLRASGIGIVESELPEREILKAAFGTAGVHLRDVIKRFGERPPAPLRTPLLTPLLTIVVGSKPPVF
jgi:hypothetical protein